MMISLRIDEQVRRRLAAVARAKGISKSEFIRECIANSLAATEQPSTAWEVGKNLFGSFNSGRGNVSIRAEELAKDRIHAKRGRKNRR
jgi:RHH-type transcriptional regulator, rel operon repressor / antitoxin RelB